MAHERGEGNESKDTKGSKANKFFGSLKDALLAAGRDDAPPAPSVDQPAAAAAAVAGPPPLAPPAAKADVAAPTAAPPAGISAEEAARLARTGAAAKPIAKSSADAPQTDGPPTTRVLRREAPPAQAAEPVVDEAARTVLVRGRQKIERAGFKSDPVVGFLVIVGGPGLGAHRPIYEGNNTVGRAGSNRVPLDFGDDTISSDAQAYIRYDSNDRSFLFVPNLAKTNVVSVNDKRPTTAVELKVMDVITLGRTQVAFVPFCGRDFDWSEISET